MYVILCGFVYKITLSFPSSSHVNKIPWVKGKVDKENTVATLDPFPFRSFGRLWYPLVESGSCVWIRLLNYSCPCSPAEAFVAVVVLV